MTDARAIPEAVQWHEGMLLSPHHFQQAARRSEALLAYTLSTIAPFGWGVRRLGIDPTLLTEGIARVTELEAVLPDGMVVVHPPEDGAAPLERALADANLDLRVQPVTVHLVVAKATARGTGNGAVRRFVSVDGAPVLDENTGDNELAVPRLRPALSLALSANPLSPPPDKYVSLPLARIGQQGEAMVLLDFSPPVLAVTRGSILHNTALQVAVRLREKAIAFGERLQSELLQGAEGVSGAGTAIRELVRTLPRLEAILRSEALHPFAVYLCLCDIVGDLALLGGQLNLPLLSGYEHRDPLPRYQEIVEFIDRVLAGLREPYVPIRFTRAGEGLFTLPMQPAWLGKTLVIGARMRPGQAPSLLQAWMAGALIGSSTRIHAIRQNRVLGAAREPIAEAPEIDLLAPPNVLLFRVQVDPVAIDAEGELNVIGPSPQSMAGEPLEIVLYRSAAPASGPADPQ